MNDLASRLESRVQITTDGLRAYLEAVENAFGGDVDFSQLIKLYGTEKEKNEARYSPNQCIGTKKNIVSGNPKSVSTSMLNGRI